jgi:uncharacterized protein YndB with AHSA1/START domain
MITVQSKTSVEGVTGRQLTDFLLYCSDEEYRRWWPGTHLHLRTLRRRPGGVGNVVYIDEKIGDVQLRATGVVIEAVPGKRIVWQLRAVVRLPVRLALDFQDDATGVHINHTICAGLPGLGRRNGLPGRPRRAGGGRAKCRRRRRRRRRNPAQGQSAPHARARRGGGMMERLRRRRALVGLDRFAMGCPVLYRSAVVARNASSPSSS